MALTRHSLPFIGPNPASPRRPTFHLAPNHASRVEGCGMREACLEADGVSRRHPSGRGVSGVSLALHPGEVLGVTGPNGSGKSTLAAVLATLQPPTAGTIRWF